VVFAFMDRSRARHGFRTTGPLRLQINTMELVYVGHF
jgi:hypothetical protein